MNERGRGGKRERGREGKQREEGERNKERSWRGTKRDEKAYLSSGREAGRVKLTSLRRCCSCGRSSSSRRFSLSRVFVSMTPDLMEFMYASKASISSDDSMAAASGRKKKKREHISCNKKRDFHFFSI